MAKRGRKSSASLAVLAGPADQIQIINRLKPPHDLTDEEVEVWAAVTGAEAADWFNPGNAPLLAQYARHVVRARHVAEMIGRSMDDPKLTIEDYDRLLKMQQRESVIIAQLATKMRVSQQATTNHRGNKKSQVSVKPWTITA